MPAYVLFQDGMPFCAICREVFFSSDDDRHVTIVRKPYVLKNLMPEWRCNKYTLCRACTFLAYKNHIGDELPFVQSCDFCPQDIWSNIHWIFPCDLPVAEHGVHLLFPDSVRKSCLEQARTRFRDHRFDRTPYLDAIQMFTEVRFRFFFFFSTRLSSCVLFSGRRKSHLFTLFQSSCDSLIL